MAKLYFSNVTVFFKKTSILFFYTFNVYYLLKLFLNPINPTVIIIGIILNPFINLWRIKILLVLITPESSKDYSMYLNY